MPIPRNMTYAHLPMKYLGYLVLGILLVMSIVFYKERTLFVDVAFQTFKMITEGGWQVQVNRFGSGLVHALPLAAIRMELPLWMVLLSYSLSFTLLFLLLYHITVQWLKNEWMGFAIPLLFTLNTFDGFYWATSELQQGLAVLLVYFAFLLKYPAPSKWWQWAVIILGIPLLATYHPVMFIPFFFMWGFFWLSDERFRNSTFYVVLLVMIVFLLVKSSFMGNHYDAGKMAEFWNNFDAYYPNLLKLPSNKIFLTRSIKFWYFFPLLFIFENGWYLWKKQWAKAILLTGFSLVFLLITHIGSPHTTYRFYAEVNYMPLTLFVILPLLFDIVPNIKKKRLVVLLFSLIFVIRLVTIYNHHRPYSNRIVWLQEQLDNIQRNYTSNKVIIPFTKELEDRLYMTWGIPYESLLLSSMNNREHSMTIFVPKGGEPSLVRDIQVQDLWFASDFGAINSDEISDNVYFDLKRDVYIIVH